MRTVRFFPAIFVLAACGGDPPATEPEVPAAVDTPPSADEEPSAPQPLTCSAGEEITLRAHVDSGDRVHVFADVARKSGTGILSVDTGSPLTFVFPDRDGPNSPATETLAYGCTSAEINTYRVPSTGVVVGGSPQIGILGTDVLFARPSLLDIGGKRLTRFFDRGAMPDTTGWITAPVEIVKKQMIVSASIDGTPVRLLVDTGAPYVLWIGQEGRPTDVKSAATDAQGNAFEIYSGASMVAIAGDPPRSVKVDRAPTFNYLDAKIAYLGGNIQGLLGLSAFGDARVLFDAQRRELRIEPRR
jgi:hypothetical protein